MIDTIQRLTDLASAYGKSPAAVLSLRADDYAALTKAARKKAGSASETARGRAVSLTAGDLCDLLAAAAPKEESKAPSKPKPDPKPEPKAEAEKPAPPPPSKPGKKKTSKRTK